MELSPDRSYVRPQKSLSIFMKTETTSSIFSEHNDMKLEINYKKKIKKSSMWRLDNMLSQKYKWL